MDLVNVPRSRKSGDTRRLTPHAPSPLRADEDDLAVLGSEHLLAMLRRLLMATGPVRRACKLLFEHLVLCSFAARDTSRPLSSFQRELLCMLHEELTLATDRWLVPRAEGASARLVHYLERSVFRLASLALSLSARAEVCEQLSSTWLPLLVRLLTSGSERVGMLSLRLLRLTLPTQRPDAQSLRDAAVCSFEESLTAQRDVSSDWQRRSRQVPLLCAMLEALGREVCGDRPLVALCCATERKMRRHGHPDGGVANGLVSMLRYLQRDGGEHWGQALGEALSAALGLAQQVLQAQGQDPEATCPSAATYLLAGAICVVGGHVDTLHEGGRVLCSPGADRAHGTVVALRDDGIASVAVDTADHVALQELDSASIVAIAEVEPTVHQLRMSKLLGTLVVLTEVGAVSPIRALLQHYAVRAVHALLAGDGGEHVASAVLGSGFLPLLLDTAVDVAPTLELPASQAVRSRLRHTDELTVLVDSRLVDAAPTTEDIQRAVPDCEILQPAVRLALSLPDRLTTEEKVVQLCWLGYPETKCEEALQAAQGNVADATTRLLHIETDRELEPEHCEGQTLEALIAMGFHQEAAEHALRRSGYDLQRAADWLLEGGVDDGAMPATDTSSSVDPTGTAGSSSQPSSGALNAGDTVEVCDECGLWHQAEVVGSDGQSIKVQYVGWPEEWSEWLGQASHRLRRSSGAAANGPASLRHVPEEMPGPPRSTSRSATGRPAEAVADPGPSRGSSRSRWFWRQSQAAAKRRVSSTPGSSGQPEVLCPSADADYFTVDVGLTRVVHRTAPAQPEAAAPAGADTVVPGRRVRLKLPGECSGSLGAVISVDDSAGSTDQKQVSLELSDAHGPFVLNCSLQDVEVPEAKLGVVLPWLAGRQLGTLLRASCTLHRAAAALHSRQLVLLLLCETDWLHAASDDEASDFQLSDLDELLPQVQRVLKLVASSATSAPASHASDALNMVWAATSNLVVDEDIQREAPSFSSLPAVLAEECVRFLARTAVGVRQAESAHPAEVADLVQMLCCAGASMIQLSFDSRSQLGKTATLGVFLDADCTQEISTFDADDYLPGESLCIPAPCVWLQYHCENNRHLAWGYKLRAAPTSWSTKNELHLLSTPYECGWDLLQFLVEELPGTLFRPHVLANILRYLQHGRAPEKDKVSMLLARALSAVKLQDVAFDWALFGTLERQVAWHDHLRQSQQFDAALLPRNSQGILALLIEIRDHLQARGCRATARPLSRPRRTKRRLTRALVLAGERPGAVADDAQLDDRG